MKKKGPVRKLLADRLWAKVVFMPDDGCQEWRGYISTNGYGMIRDTDLNRSVQAHRVSWELVNGPIPDGMTIDHLCRNRSCVRVEHLDAVPLAENIRRAWDHHRNPMCPHGHDDWGIVTRRSGARVGKTHRYCKACVRARNKARRVSVC